MAMGARCERPQVGAKKRGFTIVELMVSMAIVGGIAIVIGAVVQMGHRSWRASEHNMTVSFELRRGMTAISRELAETRATTMDATNPADDNWYPAMTFLVPEDGPDIDDTVLDPAGNVEWSTPITYALGGLGGVQILRTQVGVVNRVVANGVTTLQFRRLIATPNVVEISFTVQRGGNVGLFVQQANLTSRVRVRN